MKVLKLFTLGLFVSLASQVMAIKHETKFLTGASGYDVVAYFTENKAVRGSGFHVSSYKGTDYLFSSKKNLEIFKKNPRKYLPAYGGWCAYGVAVNKKFHADPTVFAIIDGVLYLNLDKKIQKTWSKNPSRHIINANNNWGENKKHSPELAIN